MLRWGEFGRNRPEAGLTHFPDLSEHRVRSAACAPSLRATPERSGSPLWPARRGFRVSVVRRLDGLFVAQLEQECADQAGEAVNRPIDMGKAAVPDSHRRGSRLGRPIAAVPAVMLPIAGVRGQRKRAFRLPTELRPNDPGDRRCGRTGDGSGSGRGNAPGHQRGQ